MILDNIRFKANFVGRDSWWALAVVGENDDYAIVHRLTKDEFAKLLALPEVAPLAVGPLAQRVAELQTIVDKRDDSRWDAITELFHPDMNIPDIQRAVAHLLKVHACAERVFSGKPGTAVADIKGALLASRNALWEGRPTQLEKDEAGVQPLDQEDPLAQLRNALGFVGELPELITEVKRLARIEGERVRIATHLEFTNAHVIADALRLPKLVDALSHVATFENERAVRQALRNLDPEKRGAQHNDRALWDTMFTHSFEQVLEKWHMSDEPALGSALEVAARRGATAEALWQLLDDVDTLSDQIKPTNIHAYTAFYNRSLDIAKKRHLLLKSDGYKLTWPSGDKVDRGGHPRAQVVPALIEKSHVEPPDPVPMLLHCPMCHARHIDEGEFATKSHHTHACQGYVVDEGKRRRCGHVWRPAIVATVGVEALPGFVNP